MKCANACNIILLYYYFIFLLYKMNKFSSGSAQFFDILILPSLPPSCPGHVSPHHTARANTKRTHNILRYFAAAAATRYRSSAANDGRPHTHRLANQKYTTGAGLKSILIGLSHLGQPNQSLPDDPNSPVQYNITICCMISWTTITALLFDTI